MSEAKDKFDDLIKIRIGHHERKAGLLRQYLGDGSPSADQIAAAKALREIYNLGGQSATEVSERPKGPGKQFDGSVADRAAVALGNHGAMKLLPLCAAMKTAGWKPKGTPKTSLYHAIKKDDRFTQPKRGLWALA